MCGGTPHRLYGISDSETGIAFDFDSACAWLLYTKKQELEQKRQEQLFEGLAAASIARSMGG